MRVVATIEDPVVKDEAMMQRRQALLDGRLANGIARSR
jgi:hypothetical protein